MRDRHGYSQYSRTTNLAILTMFVGNVARVQYEKIKTKILPFHIFTATTYDCAWYTYSLCQTTSTIIMSQWHIMKLIVLASPTRSLKNSHDFVFSINIQEPTVSFYWALLMTPIIIIRLAVVSLHLRHCHRTGGGKLSPSRSSGRPIQAQIKEVLAIYFARILSR